MYMLYVNIFMYKYICIIRHTRERDVLLQSYFFSPSLVSVQLSNVLEATGFEQLPGREGGISWDPQQATVQPKCLNAYNNYYLARKKILYETMTTHDNTWQMTNLFAFLLADWVWFVSAFLFNLPTLFWGIVLLSYLLGPMVDRSYI